MNETSHYIMLPLSLPFTRTETATNFLCAGFMEAILTQVVPHYPYHLV